jgi:hypothetical protein
MAGILIDSGTAQRVERSGFRLDLSSGRRWSHLGTVPYVDPRLGHGMTLRCVLSGRHKCTDNIFAAIRRDVGHVPLKSARLSGTLCHGSEL